MSDEKQETIADIVSEMRNEGHTVDSSCLGWVGAKMQRYADRIEAAANHRFREVTKMMPHEEVASAKIETTAPTGEKSSAVGDSSVMRDALEKTQSAIATCMEILNKIPDGCDYDGLVDEVADELCDLRDSLVKAALSTPPRNCDLLSDAQEALSAIHEDRGYVNNPIDERRLTVEWLFAEAKGETDGSK